ncbi:MAG TPA: type II toxin-antitoxin system prevent-host-death family antitoxin [Chloroflexota bacterium]|nr:type II toxin-antitoxin system prevent-host-death family antitoxin [Chloroflexota bacterium]
MIHAGIAELKASLSEYPARVQEGEEVIVADRGRPVAPLVPRMPGRGRLCRARLVRRAHPSRGFPPSVFRLSANPDMTERGARAGTAGAGPYQLARSCGRGRLCRARLLPRARAFG